MNTDPAFVALVGNPNSGKTTLFNALTGLRQKVGNYPGVTVEWKEGTFYSQHGHPIKLLDLPGSYSLNARSPDEQILVEGLLGRVSVLPEPTAVICCVDASNLERNLYLATQVIELGLPTIVALNMMDVAKRRGMRIDVEKLSRRLGVPVVACEAANGKGMMELRLALSQHPLPVPTMEMEKPPLVDKAIEDLVPLFRHRETADSVLARGEARLLLACDEDPGLGETVWEEVLKWQRHFDREIPGWRSEWITHRYGWIGEVMRDCVKRYDPGKATLSERADHILLHPLIGFPVLGLVMGLLFYSIFTLAVPFMEGLDGFISWLGGRAGDLLAAGPLRDLVVDGVFGGVGGVLVFLPQILFLFFFIALLESTGYMARAAFLLDRMMSKVGLHGRSFIPLLSSYACAVPGIMATRTIESPKERMVTILVAPFMTCSARLPVYLVMIAAMLPNDEGHALTKSLLLLLLYFLGTFVALGFAWVFRKTLLKGPSPSSVMELPPYRLPRWESVFHEMVDRAWTFLKRAGTIIFALSIVLWFLMNYPHLEEVPPGELAGASAVVGETVGPEVDSQLEYSFAGRLGKALEPAFKPLGYDWQITVGILSSFAAREVFVSTMAIIYRVEAEENDSIVGAFRGAERTDGSRLFTPLTCLSVLMFFVFALQCVSTVAIVRRETRSWSWPLFQFAYMFAFAWAMAFLVYQGGRLLGYS
ncbi:MAG TPA: ferrous iron transport protein B [Oceanipulchritudo sp.]|nr:ferrous iron transport protein B [Oceanipulchritudo sp.]